MRYMGFRMLEFICPACLSRFEYLADASEVELQLKTCVCGGEGERAISSPRLKTIVRGNHDYAAREKVRLDRRADDHWQKQGKAEGIDRARAQIRQHMTRVEA